MSARSVEFDAVLQRISAIGIAAKPSLQFDAAEDALGFFSDCLHTCVLPRRILVFLDGVHCLTVLGSGGRLLEIVECLGVAPLKTGPIDGAEAQVLSATLLELFGAASKISVEFHRVENVEQWALHGVTGRQLLDATGVQFLRDVDADPLEVLLEGAAEVLRAIFSPGTGLRAIACDFNAPEGLELWLAAVCKSLDAAGHGHISGSLLVYRPTQFSDMAVCFHKGTRGFTALLIQENAATDIAQYWAGLPNMLVAR